MIISGTENIEDHDDPLYALSEFYRAFNSADLQLMEYNWSASPQASMANPLGDIKFGWPQICSVYKRLFEGPFQVYVEYHDYRIQRTHELFVAVGRERGYKHQDGDELKLAIRTTRLFRREANRWRQLHHHGSPDDPGMLARYRGHSS